MGQMENLGLLDLANNSITGSILHLVTSHSWDTFNLIFSFLL
jgi:hypothetical protein